MCLDSKVSENLVTAHHYVPLDPNKHFKKLNLDVTFGAESKQN